ncbi:MAG: UDP-2,3-diacylglucosamine diphosphatase [Bacteroidales bacterium]|nr:UDP-2,3-diacylglucosamine diphosphatase [Bacteroidales bacterium]
MIYLASDLHLGYPSFGEGIARERLFCAWLDSIDNDVEELYLLGDVFDFWFEHRHVIPKGYTRFLGRIAALCDRGIPVHIFTGNHDVWMFDYLPKELGVTLHSKPLLLNLNGKRFMLHHGDGLGTDNRGYRFMKWIFNNRALQWLFANLLHPDLSQWIGHTWSRSSRTSKPIAHNFKGEEESITRFARQTLLHEPIDYFVFGHWHSPVMYPLNNHSNLVILGDWLTSNTFAQWDGQQLSLHQFSKP